MRQKKCRYCKTPFTPVLPMQVVCGIECAKAVARKKREKVEKANDRQKREQLKTRSQWMKEAQIAFNAAVRERDKGQRCISCEGPLLPDAVGGGYDCGHYRSVGSAPHLRFDERNAHGQCKKCNRYGSGMAADYRLGLIRRIGLAAVESLEAEQSPKHYAIDDLKAIKSEYVEKRKQLIKARADQL